MRAHVIVAMLAAVPAVAGAQGQPSGEPVVQVGIYGYQADGRIGVSAFDRADTGSELGTTVYLISQPQRCGMGAGNRKPPAGATDAWQFTGKVLSATSEEAVVQLNWRRLIVQGRAVTGDESSTQFTLRIGESVQLDQATLGCQTAAVAFEAKYTPRFSGMGVQAGGTGVGGGGGGRGAVSSGSGATTVNVGKAAQGGGSGTSAVPRAGGEGGGMRAATGTGKGLLDVNLWLVRAVPGRREVVTHSLLRMNQDGASFAFAPVVVTTSRGEAVVQVTGSLAVVRGTNGEDQLVFSTSRRVSPSATSQAPRDGSLDSQGMSRIVNRMPAPDEALSFELPPLKLQGQLVAPDQFSVRLTIAPR